MGDNVAYIRERRKKEFLIEMQKKGKLPSTVTEASERKVRNHLIMIVVELLLGFMREIIV